MLIADAPAHVIVSLAYLIATAYNPPAAMTGADDVSGK
jgi:hypothetical protein